jgi:hypothetical protein
LTESMEQQQEQAQSQLVPADNNIVRRWHAPDGKFLPGHPRFGGRTKAKSIRETIREYGEEGGRREKLVKLAWEKALDGRLDWAEFIMSAYPKEVSAEVGVDVKLELRETMTQQERARLFALAVRVELGQEDGAEGGA